MQKEKLEVLLSVIVASFFILLLVITLFIFFRVYIKRKNKLLVEKQIMSIQFEQTLLQSKLEIQEQTFRDISQELHDNIAQVLSLASISVNTLHAPGHEAKLTQIEELLTKALTDLRNLSHTLDTDYIRNNGWVGLVQKLFANLRSTDKYQTELDLADDLPALGDEKPIILFRMIQEVVNNIMKHANANTISLNAKKANDVLLIAIRDNGKGFSGDAVIAGAGLQNVQKRAKMINADLKIESQPGAGTHVIISIKV